MAWTPKVFLSYSRKDGHVATEVEAVLRNYRCETFLDQDDIRAGQSLSERLLTGLAWCNRVLVLWSSKAAISQWVAQEWMRAKETGKIIIPYKLDGTPLAEPLQDYVFVDRSDATHGNAELLRAIYGGRPIPTPEQDERSVLPGQWQLDIGVMGIMSTMHLELRANGQVSGKQSMWGFTGSISGTWEHNVTEQNLVLDVVASMGGQSNHDRIQIFMDSGNQTSMSGVDPGGRNYTFRKIG